MNGQPALLTRLRTGTLLAGPLTCATVVLSGGVAGPDTGPARVAGSGSRIARSLDPSPGEKAGESLARRSGATDLEVLAHSGTRADERNLVHLERRTDLRAPSIDSTMTVDAGLVHPKNLTGLQSLDLSYTGVTDDGIRQLRPALPGAIITARPAPALTTPFSAGLRGGEKHLADPASCLLHEPSPGAADGVTGAGRSCDPERMTPGSRPSHLAAGFEDPLVVRSEGTELRSVSPRTRGNIPVVFVHGMLGAPANWSFMIDRLTADASVRERFQLLTFRYDSLQSFPESARELLDALSELRRRFDPEGRDDSFDRVVLVGHSLGGLVAKSAAASASGPQPAAAGTATKVRVGRLIFVATPHRGAPLDRGIVRSAAASLARAISPSRRVRQGKGNESALCSQSSVDQLTWDHALLHDLERVWAATGVPGHSIIAALGDPSAEGATDGIVPVTSARIGGARSEVVVRASHSCVQHPEVIREVRRVLGEHAAETAGSPWSVGSPSTPPVSPAAHLAALRRPADLPERDPPGGASRRIRPGSSVSP